MNTINHSNIRRIAFIGNYQPCQCGIATFTTDLCESIAEEFKDTACIVLPVNTRRAGYEYPSRVRFEFDGEGYWILSPCRRLSEHQRRGHGIVAA